MRLCYFSEIRITNNKKTKNNITTAKHRWVCVGILWLDAKTIIHIMRVKHISTVINIFKIFFPIINFLFLVYKTYHKHTPLAR